MIMPGVTWSIEEAARADYTSIAVLEDFERYLRITPIPHPEGDDLEGRVLPAAIAAAERRTGRSLVTHAWTLLLDRWPCGPVVFPKPPLQAVDEISYRSADGTLVTLDAAQVLAGYQVSAPTGDRATYGRLSPQPPAAWPTVGAGYLDPIRIAFTAGPADSPVSLAPEILTGVYLMAGELFKQRTLSVHHVHNTPAVIRARDLWDGYRPGALEVG